MKLPYSLYAGIFFFFSLTANAISQVDTSIFQIDTTMYSFEINETVAEMSEGEHTALVITVPGADKGQAHDAWKSFMERYDGKTKKGWFSSEFHTEKAHIYSVGGVDPVDVYATFNETDKGIMGYIWFRLSESDFLNSGQYPSAFAEAKRLVNSYGLLLRQKVFNGQLQKEIKALENLKNNMQDLREEKERLEETIKKAEETITKSKAGLEKNAEAQKKLLEKLKQQEDAVNKARLRYNSTLQ